MKASVRVITNNFLPCYNTAQELFTFVPVDWSYVYSFLRYTENNTIVGTKEIHHVVDHVFEPWLGQSKTIKLVFAASLQTCSIKE